MATGKCNRFAISEIPSPLESLGLEKGERLFLLICIAVVNERGGTAIYGEIAEVLCHTKRKLSGNERGK